MIRMNSGVVGVAVLLFGLVSGLSAAQDGIGGAWELVVEAPTGPATVTMNVTVDGTKATGTLASPLGTIPLSGKATPDSVEVTGTLQMQGMSLPLTLLAKTANGQISGTMSVVDLGEIAITGKRPVPVSATRAAMPLATGVAGKWNVILVLAGLGEMPVVADLKQAGEIVTGNVVSPLGTVPVKGTFVGTALKLEFAVGTPDNPIAVTMDGQMANQGLAGKATVSGMGEADWSAVRER